MRRNDAPTLGIDLSEREIRIVHLATKGGKPYVVEAAAAPLPNGAISHGVVMEPGTVSLALRRLLDSMKPTGAAKAIFGVSGEQANFRTLSVPPCPDDELSALVEGEMVHQGFLRGDGSPHDFFRLFSPAEASDEMRSVAVVSVDASITLSLRDAADSVGLGVAAFEPAPLAMLRSAVAGAPAATTAFYLVVGPLATDAVFFVGGRPAAFRRLDVGATTLVQSIVPTPTFNDPSSMAGGASISMFGIEIDPSVFEASSPGWSHIDHASADRLAIEAQRTMEYIQRGHPDASAIDQVWVVADDPDLNTLPEMLESRFGITTSLVAPPLGVPDLRYLAAYGLAAHAIPTTVDTPRVDLFSTHRTEARREETKRNLLGLVGVSGLAIAIGAAGCLLYNRQIAQVTTRSKTTLAQIEAIRKETQSVMDQRADEEARYKTLRKEGVPLGTIMDYVVGSIDPGVGLKFVSIGEDLKLRIGGEAHDESALVRTTQGLQTSPVIANVAVNQFTRGEKTMEGILSFEISGETVSADRLKTAKGAEKR